MNKVGQVVRAFLYHDGPVRNGPADSWYEALGAKVVEAHEAERWQPIETAPKDGVTILGYGPPYTGSDGGYICLCWFSTQRSVQRWLTGRGYFNPTHWMPLPDPPGKDDNA